MVSKRKNQKSNLLSLPSQIGFSMSTMRLLSKFLSDFLLLECCQPHSGHVAMRISIRAVAKISILKYLPKIQSKVKVKYIIQAYSQVVVTYCYEMSYLFCMLHCIYVIFMARIIFMKVQMFLQFMNIFLNISIFVYISPC